MPDGANPPANPCLSREEAQDACETKGLTLCSKSAITNFPLCSVGWLSDDRGLWSDGNGCGTAGFTDGASFTNEMIGGAYCCGRPFYMPNPVPRVADYIYGSREDAQSACETKGMGLCSLEHIKGYHHCAWGWLTDDVGYWMNYRAGQCGGPGFVRSWRTTNAAFCCAAPP